MSLVPITSPTISPGESVTFEVEWFDPDPGDTHFATWVWNDGSTTIQIVNSSPFTITHPYVDAGVYPVDLTLTDSDGLFDTATYESVTVADGEAPTWSVPADINAIATGLDGAVVTYVATASDNVGVISSGCSPASGSTFPLGTTTVSCSASDAAGNVGTASFGVTVGVNEASVDTLIQEIENLALPGGVEKSLMAPLKQVRKLINDSNPDNDIAACDKLAEFADKVADRLAAGVLSESEAGALTMFAQALRVEFGCG